MHSSRYTGVPYDNADLSRDAWTSEPARISGVLVIYAHADLCASSPKLAACVMS